MNDKYMKSEEKPVNIIIYVSQRVKCINLNKKRWTKINKCTRTGIHVCIKTDFKCVVRCKNIKIPGYPVGDFRSKSPAHIFQSIPVCYPQDGRHKQLHWRAIDKSCFLPRLPPQSHLSSNLIAALLSCSHHKPYILKGQNIMYYSL